MTNQFNCRLGDGRKETLNMYVFGHNKHEFHTSFYLDLTQIIGKLGYLFVICWFYR